MAVRNRWLAELALFAGLAVLHTWPLATNPGHLTRLDNNDTAFNTWVVAWVAHQAVRDPLHLFEAPIFYPAHDTLAYSEHMFTQAMMGAPMLEMGASPVLVYNLLVLLGNTLSALAMAWLIQRWTGSRAAGLVAGALFGFNAHLLTRFAHLQAQHVEFLPVVLFALDRVLTAARTRDAALLAAAFVLQALCSNYTMVLMTMALAVALCMRRELWRAGAKAVWPRLIGAAMIAAVVLIPFLLPYYRVRNEQGLLRTIDDVRIYSAGWQDYLTTGGRLHYWAWSYRFFDGRTALFPGITAVALSAVAVAAGVAWRDPRPRMALAFGTAGVLLSFGAALPGYAWLHEHVPLLQGIRAASRWGFLLLVAVAVLAGFGVAVLEQRWRLRRWWPAVVLALLALVTVEALRAPLTLRRFDGLRHVHARLKDPSVKAIIVFPLYPGNMFHGNAPYLLDQTEHWRPMFNGYSSFAPGSFFERAERLRAFPAHAAIEEMRSLGISHVVLHRAPLQAAYGAQAIASLRAHAELEYLIEQDGVILYRIR